MRAYDIIDKKKNGGELSREELQFLIGGYVDGSIPDYQMSAFLMAVYFNNMSTDEITVMTDIMSRSGDIVDLSAIDGIKVDKHSTGGVGDKTTLILGPIVAACGAKVAKMSGRGLGHTGGTVDKLESIPGMKVDLDREDFFKIVREIGVCVIGQSGNLAPADKKLYALRDVTATVDSIPLIASSIMSKKLAAGSDSILLDVKVGSGAFMKTYDDAVKLAQVMVGIGEGSGKPTIAIITNMDVPLGNAIGNSIEVIESIDTLRGEGPEDLTYVSKILASNMLYLAGIGDMEDCSARVDAVISNGEAFEVFVKMVAAQRGDTSVVRDTGLFVKSKFNKAFKATSSGYIEYIDALSCGIASSVLGAGRETKESDIDYSAGIKLCKKLGEYVEDGEILAMMYTDNEALFIKAQEQLCNAYRLTATHVASPKMILAKVSKDGVEEY